MKTVKRFNEWWSYRSLGEKTMFVLIAIVGVLSVSTMKYRSEDIDM